jgi:hypothetical protein
MVRNNRHLIRLSFILVLAMALFGAWFANANWRIEVDDLAQLELAQGGNWVDFFSTLGEEALQLFLGFTSSQ